MFFHIKWFSMRLFRTALLLSLFLVAVPCYSADEVPKEDATIKLFSLCGSSGPCIAAESLVFAPIFPWFLYPLDIPASPAQLRKFENMGGSLDFLLTKANEHFSGYRVNGAFTARWIGVDVGYETYNNGSSDLSMYTTHFIFRPFPRKHIQPKLLIGWVYINTDTMAGGGLHISFFNYDINFSRRFSMFVVNYIGWIKGYTIVEGIIGAEYYIYPSISLKAAMDLKHVFAQGLYGIEVGVSFKI